MSDGDEFERALRALRTALTNFGWGDPEPYAALWSTRDDVTIFGAFGAYEQGWTNVYPRLVWAASFMPGGASTYRSLATGCGGELGYEIGLELGVAPGPDEPRAGTLRVTHLFRKEADQWKIMHRHADAVSEQSPPGPRLR